MTAWARTGLEAFHGLSLLSALGLGLAYWAFGTGLGSGIITERASRENDLSAAPRTMRHRRSALAAERSRKSSCLGQVVAAHQRLAVGPFERLGKT
jgi:hypothetical protein